MSHRVQTDGNIDQLVIERIRAISPDVIAWRRDFHRYAELGWTEFRTASLIARRLHEAGVRVQCGKKVICDEERMGLPSAKELEAHYRRAVEQGGDREYLPSLRGGFTGVVGTVYNGDGPIVAMRFDIDAVGIDESRDPEHRPAREGFASVNPGAMHACGHDAHAAIGLGIAIALVSLREHWRGTLKLIFQPAEEGVRGARAMVHAGVVDDVRFLLGHHLHSGWKTGHVVPGMGGYLATTKFDAILTGHPAHAGASPQLGKNALLAAATAVLNLHAISRHRHGATRINVGQLIAGTGRNVVCPTARLVAETRGRTTELNDYVYERAVCILRSAAEMYECRLEIVPMGSAQSAESDVALSDRVAHIAAQIDGLHIRPPEPGGGSEDFTYMMRRVQERGGLATNIGIGAGESVYGHHTAQFDLDESAFTGALLLLTQVAMNLMSARR